MRYSNKQIREALEKVASLAGLKSVAKGVGRSTKNLAKGKTSLPQYGRQLEASGRKLSKNVPGGKKTLVGGAIGAGGVGGYTLGKGKGKKE